MNSTYIQGRKIPIK